MIDVTPAMRAELKVFSGEHHAALSRTANALRGLGIRRVHFGVDYVNDAGEPADYAVIEFTDGRVVEQETWLEELPYDVFFSGLRYCQPYTFDTGAVELTFDESGGTVDTEANVIRVYHSAERQARLRDWARESEGLEGFFLDHIDELTHLGAVLEALDVADLCFGLDWVGNTLELSDWRYMARRMHGDVILPLHAEPPELAAFTALLEQDFPLGGAFIFDTVQCAFRHDPDGGLVSVAPVGGVAVQRAYRTDAQRSALEVR
ncbi:MAG: hypothetical protein IT355_20930 [Gemmatimonadaceae bacterium]|nr:hypothetical protein [Gemmatimonadaceae bacterium]